MAEWFYLERVLADRARDLARHMAKAAAFRPGEMLEERPVLSTGVGCWSWRRAARVGAVVGLALAGTIAVPMGIVGAAWAMGVVVRLFLG
jgi:hypothetical protein